MDKIKRNLLAMYVALAALLVPSLAYAEGEVGYNDFQSVITAMQNQVSVSTIVGVLAQAVGIAIGFVFLWWGVIKVKNIIMAAWQARKLRV